jgi:hypothetical protein
VWEQIQASATQGRERFPVAPEDELEASATDSFGDIPAIREAQREQPCRPASMDGQSLWLEAMDDRPRNTHEDDDADSEEDVHPLVRRAPSREEDERRMVAGPRARGRFRGQPERAGCVWSETQPAWLRVQPSSRAMERLDPRLAVERSCKTGPRHPHDQRTRARVPHGDRRA